jgi:hypothetical protein
MVPKVVKVEDDQCYAFFSDIAISRHGLGGRMSWVAPPATAFDTVLSFATYEWVPLFRIENHSVLVSYLRETPVRLTAPLNSPILRPLLYIWRADVDTL